MGVRLYPTFKSELDLRDYLGLSIPLEAAEREFKRTRRTGEELNPELEEAELFLLFGFGKLTGPVYAFLSENNLAEDDCPYGETSDPDQIESILWLQGASVSPKHRREIESLSWG